MENKENDGEASGRGEDEVERIVIKSSGNPTSHSFLRSEVTDS